MSAQDVIAEVLDEQIDRAMSTEILRELRKSGFVIVELPEPDLRHDDGYQEWLDGTVTCTPGYGKVRIYLDDPRWDTVSALELAAAILAAARHAEAGERGE